MDAFKKYAICIRRESFHIVIIRFHVEFISWSKCQCALLIILEDASLGFWLFLKSNILIEVLQTLYIVLLKKSNSLIKLEALNISKVQITKYDFDIVRLPIILVAI